MADPVQLSVGRVRVTRAVAPSEPGYIEYIRSQMRDIQTVLLRTIKHIDGVTPEAIRFGLQPIFDESQRLVPVDWGILKASGFIETRKTSTGAVAAIGYGRHGKPPYAAFVHERMDLRHAPPTQAKFLEEAVFRKLDVFRRRVSLYIQRKAGLQGG